MSQKTRAVTLYVQDEQRLLEYLPCDLEAVKAGGRQAPFFPVTIPSNPLVFLPAAKTSDR